MSPARRRGAWLAGVVLLSAAGLLYLYSSRRAPATDAAARQRLARLRPAPGDLNVVVVTLDTTRADRLGCYGFGAVATPHIDGLAREGVLFEQATASVPLTLPSHSTIFTGLLPPRHGVHDNGGFLLDEAKVTLAERFRDAGYATGAFVAAWVLDSKWGIGQGFETYSDRFDLSKFKVVSLGTVQKRGDEVMSDALAWLEGVRSRKFLAWVHLYDPHAPFDPPEPFASRYPQQPYLGEIAYTDQVVGRLLDFLRERRLLERTLVVLTADHGESLGDHGESAHSYFIYDATTRVPLIVRTPWGLAGRSRTQVGSADILPTVLDLAGLPPQPGVDGRSLVRALFDPGLDLGLQSYSETYYPRFHYGWQHLQSLRDGRYKLVEAPTPELYDLERDPEERKNLHAERGETAERLRSRLRELAGDGVAAAPEPGDLDPETLQRLAALGYVGSARKVDPQALLPDPKDKLGVYQRMHEARELAQKDKVADAIEAMRQVLKDDPEIVDAHVALGNFLMRARRGQEAIQTFQQALALQPDNSVAIVNLANAYRARGEHAAAIEGYRRALSLDAKSPQLWFQLASLYLDLGRLPEAEQTFRRALETNETMGAAWNGLGAIAWARGRAEEAERLVRKGLELEPEQRTASFNLGRILEQRNDRDGALALYRQELERYPDNGKARFNLAQLLRERGDRRGYLLELQASIEKAPDFGPAFFVLAREELAAGGLDTAFDIARRGLEVDPRSELAPLGHYVLADVWNRRGDAEQARLEVHKARQLETALRRNPPPRI
jgi:arylsulfatase A-like enzyme/Tfp pilus assembly protein PilF